jgi:hypothetical protein
VLCDLRVNLRVSPDDRRKIPLQIKYLITKIGAAEGIRTPDPLITNEVLYQLSYRGTRDHDLSDRGLNFLSMIRSENRLPLSGSCRAAS